MATTKKASGSATTKKHAMAKKPVATAKKPVTATKRPVTTATKKSAANFAKNKAGNRIAK